MLSIPKHFNVQIKHELIMKKIFCLTFVCFVTTSLLAQQDTTTIYSRTRLEKDPERSLFNKTVTRKDSSWELTLKDKRGVLRELITFADEKLEVREGPYARYVNSKLVEDGNYKRGYKVGNWKTYYPNRQLASDVNYLWDKFDGNYKRFWENGQLKEQSVYENGRRISKRTLYYSDGKLAAQESYGTQGLAAASYFDISGQPTKAQIDF